MSTLARWIFAMLLLGERLSAQPPAIFQDGIANAASRVSTVLPFGALAPGSRVRFTGVRFGAHPTLIVRSQSTRFRVKPLKTEERTADFLLPRELSIGGAELSLEAEGGESKKFTVRIAASSFGIHALRRANRTVTLEGTGIGRDNPHDLEVVAGGIAVRPDSIRSGDTGIDQIQFRIPDGVPKGCHLPVYVRTTSHVSNFADLADLPGCQDDGWPVLSPRPKGSGSLIMLRSSLTEPAAVWTADSAYATFLTTAKQPLEAPLWFPLSPGQCRLQSSTEVLERDPFRLLRINSAAHSSISAGSSISYSKRSVGVDGTGSYHATLGGGSPEIRHPKPLFFEAGKTYTLAAQEGKTGPFSVKAPFVDDLDFAIPRDSNGDVRIDLTQPLKVRWRTRQPMVAIVVESQTSSSIVEAVCAANGGDGQFNIPPDILRSLPPSENAGLLTGYAAVASISHPVRFRSKGLERGIASSVRFRVQRAAFY